MFSIHLSNVSSVTLEFSYYCLRNDIILNAQFHLTVDRNLFVNTVMLAIIPDFSLLWRTT